MISVRPIQPGDLHSVLDFFDARAFTDNPGWAFCYCNCFFADHCEKPWTSRTAPENRAATAARITSGQIEAYGAFDSEKLVGWCGAGPMEKFPDFAEDPDPDRAALGVITCFLVAPEKRRQGVARLLLQEICREFARRGLRFAEGNPRPKAQTPAEQHFGPLALFLSEGFTVTRTDPDDGSVYVRKPL